MGFLDGLNALLGRRSSGPRSVEWIGPTFQQMILGLTPEELYRTQPHLRTVISFVARNVAHLGLKAYARASDTDRRQLVDDPLSKLLARPNPDMTRFELLETLASDMALYDAAFLFLAKDANAEAGWVLRPIPPSWVVGRVDGTFFAPGAYIVQNPNGTRAKIPAESMVEFHGWNPGEPKNGTSPVETLKQVLAEQVQAWSYREQLWQRGGRVGAYLTRPKDAAWSDAARERFARDWKDRWTGKDGKQAGGTPILEDGMELKRIGFSAREDEWSEVSKIALATVASVYHVNPVMVGILDNANFSNTKEFRKMLYSETLGPQLARIEDRLNAFLVPKVAKDPTAYVEFNIQEKLQGDFEEQAAILSTSTGVPWMTVNEARARQNLPALPGGDERVIPLNVLVGGQASPQDSGEQNADVSSGMLAALAPLLRSPRALPAVKSAAPMSFRAKEQGEPEEAALRRSMEAFFARQRDAVLSAMGAKADGWWDAERWDRELAADLLVHALGISKSAALRVLDSLGLDASSYDVGSTEEFLRAVAESRAGAINAVTRDQLEAIRAGDGPEGVDDPGHVFDVARESRAASVATTFATTLAAFGVTEAAKQQGGSATKTWLVTSSDPRASHARMNGETVGVREKFSNGANWPGDPVLGAEGVANCKCDVEVTFEVGP